LLAKRQKLNINIRNFKYAVFFILILFLLTVGNSFSQTIDSLKQKDFSKLTLQELIETEISVTNQINIPLNESPGIVSVITEEEIKNSGARNLLELLQHIPGFDFGAEWDNILGIGIRGNNATEGKFLILYDGHQLNETNFGSFSFGNHLLLNNISKIEIIRGPGSVIYGGLAELAVINIISKKGSENNGVTLSSEYGFSNNATSYYAIQTSSGKKFNNGLDLIISAGYKRASRSNRKIETLDSTIINYEDSSAIESGNIAIHGQYKGSSTRFMYDRNLIQNTEATGYVLFENLFASTDYEIKIKEHFILKPRVNIKYQKPWFFIENKTKEFYNSINSKYAINLPFTYDSKKKITLIMGLDAIWDHSKKINDTVVFSLNNKKEIDFYNFSAFGEVLYKSKVVNVTAGGRIEHQNIYGTEFVPRIILTKKIKKISFKLLFNKAFKAPTISNIDYNNDINPEITTVYEFETGMQLTDEFNVTVNLFDIFIKNPILYIPNPVTGADYYTNFPQTGSRGIETECKIKNKWGYFTASYSYYQKAYNKVPLYDIHGIDNSYSAFPNHKATVRSCIELNKNIKINISLLTFSERYTYMHNNKNWSAALLKNYRSTYLVNFNILFKNLFAKKIDASFGIHDLMNQKFEYINAYQGWQNPIPAMGREFFVKLTYDLKFEDKPNL